MENILDEITASLSSKDTNQNNAIRQRQTKIIATLGKYTKDVEPLKAMINKGMDMARINMNYFET